MLKNDRKCKNFVSSKYSWTVINVWICIYRVRSQENNAFEIRFRTTATRGLLLLLHKSATIQGDYLAIALNRGRIEVSYNLGKETTEDLHVIQSQEQVNDNQWHTIVFTREQRQGSLVVDNGRPLVESSGQGANQLDTDGNLWIGGCCKRNWHHGFCLMEPCITMWSVYIYIYIYIYIYRKVSNIRHTKSQNLNVSRLAGVFAQSNEARC